MGKSRACEYELIEVLNECWSGWIGDRTISWAFYSVEEFSLKHRLHLVPLIACIVTLQKKGSERSAQMKGCKLDRASYTVLVWTTLRVPMFLQGPGAE